MVNEIVHENVHTEFSFFRCRYHNISDFLDDIILYSIADYYAELNAV